MKTSPSPLWLGAFIAGIAALAFIGGAAGVHYRWPPATGVIDALSARDAWTQQEKELAATGALPSLDDAMRRHVVSGDASKAYQGVTLLTFRYSTSAYMVGMDGDVLHRWDMPFSKAFPHPAHINAPMPDENIYMFKALALPNGDLLALYHGNGDTPYGYGLAMMDKNSTPKWAYAAHAHHDFQVDPENGDIHVLVQEFVKTSLPGLDALDYPLLNDYVVTLSPDGVEKQRISIIEAFQGTPYELVLYRQPRTAPWDVLHTNTVAKLEPALAAKFPMFKAGQFLLSMRNLDTIAVLDPETQKIVWAQKGPWTAQHDAKFLDNGHILLLDNQGHFARGQRWSRVIEFDPTTSGVPWSYTGGHRNAFFTDSYGRVQRLPNGNTLVADAASARVFEVTPEGTIAWNYRMPRIYAKNLGDPGETPHPGGIDPTLSNLISSATRYAEESLPFLAAGGTP
jgi:hypothetical protein